MSIPKAVTIALLAACLAAMALAKETVVISGAGPSTVVVTEFFHLLAMEPGCEEYEFVVPPRSIKHAGGLNASDTNLFGRTGRPLTPDEMGESRAEIYLAKVPLTFVIDPDVGITTINRQQLTAILLGEISNWQAIGGPDIPIKLVGREPTEAVLMALAETLPEITLADFQVRLTRDHQLVQMLDTADKRGVLSFGAVSNFESDMTLAVDGLEIGLAVGLVYNLANNEHPLIKQIKAFRSGDSWRNRVIELGLVSITEEDSVGQAASQGQ